MNIIFKKAYKLILFSFLSFSLFLLLFFFYRNQQTDKLKYSLNLITDEIINSMDDSEILGQLFFLFLPPEFNTSFLDLKPGGLFIQNVTIPKKNINHNKVGNQQNLIQLKKKLTHIKKQFLNSNVTTPFISVDQEYGRVQRLKGKEITEFPSAMSLGEAINNTNDYNMAMLMGFYSCYELKDLSIDIPFAPVTDILYDINNSVIANRSFSSNKKMVFNIAKSYIAGLKAAQCIDTIKHFPGHGSTSIDSHKALPVILKKKKSFFQDDIFPFEKLLKDNIASSVMIGHLLISKVDQNVSSISPYWIQKKIKKQWNYKGLIITDDLGMKGILKKNSKEEILKVCYQALTAGVDILLLAWGTSKYAHYIQKKILEKMQFDKNFYTNIKSSTKKIIHWKLKTRVLEKFLKKKSFKNVDAQKILLQYYESLRKKRTRYFYTFPKAESINKEISKNAVKLLKGKNLQNFKNSILFTDDMSRKYQSLNNVNHLSRLHTIYKKKSHTWAADTKIIFLHLKLKDSIFKRQICNFIKKNNPVTPIYIFSTMNPYPFNSFGYCLRKQDSLVLSFSRTKWTQHYLLEALLTRKQLKQAIVKYF